MAALRHTTCTAHPHTVDGRSAVAGKHMGRQHGGSGQATQGHMLGIEHNPIRRLAHSDARCGTGHQAPRCLRPALHGLQSHGRGHLRLAAAVQGLTALNPQAPIHIHIAEQTQEVDDCIAWSGQRPVQWLLNHAPVDERWCLVHATHMTPDEYAGAARTGAVAGICPTTEANLGDGIFDMPLWLQQGGRWGVGSDSHACVNAAEELLMLEYGQRLSRRQRNVLASSGQPEVATAMALQAVQGGAQASGRWGAGAAAGIAVGQSADWVVLDAQHVALRGLTAPAMLSAHVFASHRTSAIDSVWVGGASRVAQGCHALHDPAASAFAAARASTIAPD